MLNARGGALGTYIDMRVLLVAAAEFRILGESGNKRVATMGLLLLLMLRGHRTLQPLPKRL